MLSRSHGLRLKSVEIKSLQTSIIITKFNQINFPRFKIKRKHYVSLNSYYSKLIVFIWFQIVKLTSRTKKNEKMTESIKNLKNKFH